MHEIIIHLAHLHICSYMMLYTIQKSQSKHILNVESAQIKK